MGSDDLHAQLASNEMLPRDLSQQMREAPWIAAPVAVPKRSALRGRFPVRHRGRPPRNAVCVLALITRKGAGPLAAEKTRARDVMSGKQGLREAKTPSFQRIFSRARQIGATASQRREAHILDVGAAVTHPIT